MLTRKMLTQFLLVNISILYANHAPAIAIPAEVPIDNVLPFVKSSHETEGAALMNERFGRNLTMAIPKRTVVVRFFLLPDGHIRDVQIEKSGGLGKMALVFADAILCASPLPKPPYIRKVLPPPPSQNFLPSEYFGSGVYRYTFYLNQPKEQADLNISGFRRIPREVLFRYPNLFNATEIDSQENMMKTPPLDVSHLEDIRMQWAKFYDKHSTSTKEEIEKFARDTELFLSGRHEG